MVYNLKFTLSYKCILTLHDILLVRNIKITGLNFRLILHTYVPECQPVCESDINKLKHFFCKYKNNIVVLTGAGISTESGIPDYRSKDVGLYARSNHKPMTYLQFIKDDNARKRYWARSFVGWPQYSSVLPNAVHYTLRTLQEKQIISSIITQNVDNLHFKAGSQNVIELHGTLHRVICITCREYTIDRHKFQLELKNLNFSLYNLSPEIIRPDGDVELSEEHISTFNLPNCPKCNGYLKPDVIFFGENVPIQRIELVKTIIKKCNSVLVLGSSLSVFSAYRIILQAHDLNKGICIVNIGSTRGDNLSEIKIEGKCGDILPQMIRK